MIMQSRVALGLAALALLGGVAAIYVPARQFTADIDRALQQEDDVLAGALTDRLLLDAEEDVRALAILADANGVEGLDSVGDAMREAVRVNAVIVSDARGTPIKTFAAIDTPSGLGRTPTVKAMARQAASQPALKVSRGFVLAYGQTYVAAATQLPHRDADGSPIVAIVFTRIEQSVMKRVSTDYGLVNLDLNRIEPHAGTPAVALRDTRGRVTGYLTWQAMSPAQRMLEQLAPWIVSVVLAVAAILVLLALVTFRAHRRAATAALANQVLEKSDRAKSLLFANLSHEFRTPLNAVIGFADLIKRELYGPVGHEKYAEYVRDIHSSASHLLGLIEDVLVLSRYDASEGMTLNDPVSLDHAIGDAVGMLEGQAARKGLRLIVGRMSGLKVLCSEKASRQIAINLIGNAIKYTESGSVRVSASAADDGNAVDLVIVDTGIGIPEAHLSRIVRPFEQVDDVYARKQGGTGLGLSIVTSIVAHAGGRLKLESAPGKGTRVTVTFRSAAMPESRQAA